MLKVPPKKTMPKTSRKNANTVLEWTVSQQSLKKSMPRYIQTIPKLSQNAPKMVPKRSQNGPKTAPRAKTPPSHPEDAAKTPPRHAQDTPRGTQGVRRRAKAIPNWHQNPTQNQCKISLKINTLNNPTCLQKNQPKSYPKSFAKCSPNSLENAWKKKQAKYIRKCQRLYIS